MIIGFPPCTKVSNAGACRLYPQKGKLNLQRFYEGLCGKAFFETLWAADCEKVCLENPMPSGVFEYRQPSQIIEPYLFGDGYTKRTYLWIRGLPVLWATNY